MNDVSLPKMYASFRKIEDHRDKIRQKISDLREEMYKLSLMVRGYEISLNHLLSLEEKLKEWEENYGQGRVNSTTRSADKSEIL